MSERANPLPSMVASSRVSVSKAWSVTNREQEDHLNRAGLRAYCRISQLQFYRAQLEALTAEQLSYGHSGGRVETKAQFIEGVMTRKAILTSLALSDHTIALSSAPMRSRAIQGHPKAKPTASSPAPRSACCRSGRSKGAPGNCWPVRVSGRRKRRDGLLWHR